MDAYFSPSPYKDALYARIRRAHDVEQVFDRPEPLSEFLENFRWNFVRFCVGRHVHLVISGIGAKRGYPRGCAGVTGQGQGMARSNEVVHVYLLLTAPLAADDQPFSQ